MLQGFVKRFIFSAVVSEGSKSPLAQRVAAKTARLERDAHERLGVWARAVYTESRKDLENIFWRMKGNSQERVGVKAVERNADRNNGRRE